MNISRLALLAFSLPASICFAGKATELKPVLAKPGKAVIEDNFSGSTLGKAWAANKGDWQVKDGTVVGKEKASDKHPGVLLLQHPFRNSIVRFSFKFDGSKALSLSLNQAKGHLFRVELAPDGLVLSKDKDKKDEKSKGLQLAKAAAKFEQGQWYTMQVEMDGTRVAVQTDNGIKVDASNPELDVDKIGYRFVTRGESVVISDLKVWDVSK